MNLWQRADAHDLRSLAAFGTSLLGSLGIGLTVLTVASTEAFASRSAAIAAISLLLLAVSYAIWPSPKPRLSTFVLYPLPWGAILAVAAALAPLLRSGELPRARLTVVAGVYAVSGLLAFILISRRGVNDSAAARRPTSGCS